MANPTPPPREFVRMFNPVVVRNRHDGWSTEKQVKFIEALAESACVTDACRRVGMSTESAYALRRRYDAVDFRLSWDAALEYAVQRLSDAALSRAIHGVAVPHYYKGEVVGEHRRFDEGLTRFILRYRDPVRYAKHWDGQSVIRSHPEEHAERLAAHLESLHDGGHDSLHEYENEVIDKVAIIATEAELDELEKRQRERGVGAAVDRALYMLDGFDREMRREEQLGLVTHDAPEPGVVCEDIRPRAAIRPAACAMPVDPAPVAAPEVDDADDAGFDDDYTATPDYPRTPIDPVTGFYVQTRPPGEGVAFRSDVASTSSTSAPGTPDRKGPAHRGSSAGPAPPPPFMDPSTGCRPWYPLPKVQLMKQPP